MMPGTGRGQGLPGAEGFQSVPARSALCRMPGMASITFDTHKYVKDLESAGVPQVQAEAFVRAQQEILSQTLDSTLATKADTVAIERRIDTMEARMEGRFTLMQWMLGIIVGGVIMLVLKAFFPV